MKLNYSKIKYDWDAGHCYGIYDEEYTEEQEDEVNDFLCENEERVCVPQILLDWGIDVVVCECGCVEDYLDNSKEDYLDEVIRFADLADQMKCSDWYQTNKIRKMVKLERTNLLTSLHNLNLHL